MVATTCVHCGARAHIAYFPKHNSWEDPLLLWTSTQRHPWLSAQQGGIISIVNELDELMRVHVDGVGWEKWRIGVCYGCRLPLFLVLNDQETDILRVYPPISLKTPEGITDGVADDYVEASLCLAVGAYKAAAAMCRRALQAAALDKGCKRAKLKRQLKELSDKGLLNPSLLEVAHQVRYFGNYGAHPDEDGLGDVSQQEAETIRDLTWQVLEDLYINPARVEAMRVALAQKEEREPSAESTTEGAEPSAAEEA